MPVRSLPPDAPLRVVGDVHGDSVAFRYAAATDRFVVQLGDLTDYGPDNAGTLHIMFRLIDEGRGLFLLGNHDLKLARFLAGHAVRDQATLDATLAQLDADCASASWLRSPPHRPGCSAKTRSSCTADPILPCWTRPRRNTASTARTGFWPGAVRGANRAHAARRLPRAQPALGRSHPRRHHGVLRPRPP